MCRSRLRCRAATPVRRSRGRPRRSRRRSARRRRSCRQGPLTEPTARWLADTRRLDRHAPRVYRALTHVEEMCSVATRTLFGSMRDWAGSGMPEPDDRYTGRLAEPEAELPAQLAVVVRDVGQLLQVAVEALRRGR